MEKRIERMSRRESVTIGFYGGALIGIPSHFIVGDISGIVDGMGFWVLLGIAMRILLLGGMGPLYAYVVPLAADRWSALERGIMAPVILSIMIWGVVPSTTALNDNFKTSSSISIMSVAHASNKDLSKKKKKKKKKKSIIREIIKGIVGK